LRNNGVFITHVVHHHVAAVAAAAAASRLRLPSVGPVRALAASEQQSDQVELVATVAHLLKWLQGQGAPCTDRLEPKRFKADSGERVGMIAARDVQAGEVLLEVPESLAVTAIDAEKHDLVGPIAAQCSELVGLTLWLMAERARGSGSPWCQLLQTLPHSTASPILWEDQERVELLTGSPVLKEARDRQAALQQQWTQLNEQHFSKATDRFSPAVFNEAAFMRSFCVVLACSTYLAAAECFALVPVAGSLARTGNDNGCTLDYDAQRQAVVVTTTRPYRCVMQAILSNLQLM
jgi:histone-lysine N-methyltransferase SETD3